MGPSSSGKIASNPILEFPADSLGISLWDSAGAIVIEDTFRQAQCGAFSIFHDRMNYGEYFGLDACNAYVATTSLGNLGDREPMQAVYRTAGLARPIGGISPQVLVITTTGTMAGEVSLSSLPTVADPPKWSYTGSETGTYALERGGTAYEFTNHLGNVLAVVSDKKLGQDTNADLHAEYYHPETMMLTDYYPFGSPMVGRTWQSGGYRYGFNGMQKDNEVVGEANGYDFGARLYDGRVGRWWSRDPKSWEYPFFSPFIAFNSNPIFIVDPNGKSGEAVINKESRTITVTSVYGFYGTNVSSDRAKKVAQEIEDDYNQAKGIVEIDGIKYHVQFCVIGVGYSTGGNSILEQGVKTDIENNMDIRFNFVRLENVSDDYYGGVSYTDDPNNLGLGANTGYWSINQLEESQWTTGSHEYNHSLAGLNHPEKINPSAGKNNLRPSIDMTESSKKFTLDEFEVVGISGISVVDVSHRTVQQKNIDAIFSDEVKGQLKLNGSAEIGVLSNKYHEK